MGYDPSRFVGNVDDELKCPICCSILKDALQAPDCEHTFCNVCINEWLKIQCNCPVDRRPITRSELKPAPRVLRNFLAKLDIKCDFASSGCPTVVKLESLTIHCNECEFNPSKPVFCEKGCGLVLFRNQVEEHNCLFDLRELVSNQQKQINEVKNAWRLQEEQMNELKANLKGIQEGEISELIKQIRNIKQHIEFIQEGEINEQLKQIRNIQQRLEIFQKQFQTFQRSQSPINDDEWDCDLCDATPRSCVYASVSRKRALSWKDGHSSKRPPSTGKLNSLDHGASSPFSDDYSRHHFHHHHHPSSPLSDFSSQSHQQLITFYGSVITLNVADDETVESVKSKIFFKEGIASDQQLLFYAGQQLEDEKTLLYYNINCESSKHLILRLRDGMKIFVKTLSDKTIEVQVDPSETIEIVKVKIHEQEGISPCDQRLLLDGRDLADLRTLSDYGIKHNSTLQLDLHLGGPCPICQSQFKNSNTRNASPISGKACPSPSTSALHHSGKHD